MTRVLITAYEPYDDWPQNASWLALVELVKDLPREPKVTTRLYPVDFAAVKAKLADDLAGDFDVALHLGQAPGLAHVQLEAIGINVAGAREQSPDDYGPLAEDGPPAYRSRLPLGAWAGRLRRAGIPARVSYHAGTYLCNAALYLTHYLAEKMNLKTQAAFLHLPLDVSQATGRTPELPAMPAATTAAAVRLILEDLAVEG